MGRVHVMHAHAAHQIMLYTTDSRPMYQMRTFHDELSSFYALSTGSCTALKVVLSELSHLVASVYISFSLFVLGTNTSYAMNAVL